MLMKPWVRVILMGVLIVALGIPSGAWTALAQQEGPQSPAPAREPSQPAPPVPGPSQSQKPSNQAPPPPQVAISVQSNLVAVEAVVTDQDGNIVTGLKRDNFRVLDDGNRQQITNFAPTEAPITVVMLMEFSKRFGGYFGYKAKDWSYSFLSQLKQQDWVALKTFDLKTTLVDDFTQDKRQVEQDIASLFFPSFSEANLFDALLETRRFKAPYRLLKLREPALVRAADKPNSRPLVTARSRARIRPVRRDAPTRQPAETTPIPPEPVSAMPVPSP